GRDAAPRFRSRSRPRPRIRTWRRMPFRIEPRVARWSPTRCAGTRRPPPLLRRRTSAATAGSEKGAGRSLWRRDGVPRRHLAGISGVRPRQEALQPFVQRHAWLKPELKLGLADIWTAPLGLIGGISIRVVDDAIARGVADEFADALRQVLHRHFRFRVADIVGFAGNPAQQRQHEADHRIDDVAERAGLLPGPIDEQRLAGFYLRGKVRQHAVVAL